MPKMKTNRMAKKKLFPNKKGTVKRAHANKTHKTANKSGKVMRRLTKRALVAKVDIKAVRRLLPYA